jgi:hypothetical protein
VRATAGAPRFFKEKSMSYSNNVSFGNRSFIDTSKAASESSESSSSSEDSQLRDFGVRVVSEPCPSPAMTPIQRLRSNLDELLGHSKNLDEKKDAITSAILKLERDQPGLVATFNRQMTFAPTLKKLLHFTPSETSASSPAERILVRTGVAIAIARDAGPKELEMLRKYLVADVLGDRAEVLKQLDRADCNVARLVDRLWSNPAFLKAYAMEASV